jgi:hypothetical protein
MRLPRLLCSFAMTGFWWRESDLQGHPSNMPCHREEAADRHGDLVQGTFPVIEIMPDSDASEFMIKFVMTSFDEDRHIRSMLTCHREEAAGRRGDLQRTGSE